MIGRRFGSSRVYCAVLAMLAVVGSGSLAAQTGARELFQRALHEEVALGNIQVAIELYEKALMGTDADLNVKAALRLAGLYAKVGRHAEARNQLESIVGSYTGEPSYREIVGVAREALAELGVATPQDEPRELPEPGFTSRIAPDGRRGTFSAIDEKGMNVGVIDYETGAITWITDLEWVKNNGAASQGIWAPDSRRLAYTQVTSDGSALVVSVRQDDESNSLGLVSLSDGSFTQLRTVPWQGLFDPYQKASPDGRFVMIQEEGDLFLLATDGSGKVQLTDHPAADAETLAWALASYVRSILAGDSPVDRFRRGDRLALSPEEAEGLRIFVGKGNCTACHVGPNFTDEEFHNTGVAWREGELADLGRFRVTGLARHRGAFKTPTLRELSRTAPYMHDGSIGTLEEVVDFYDGGGNPNPSLDGDIRLLGLAAYEKQALVGFLRALTGSVREGMR